MFDKTNICTIFYTKTLNVQYFTKFNIYIRLLHQKTIIMKDLNIKELRNEKGFSQAELAKRIGVSRQTIVNYEKGEVIPESKKELLYNILQSIPVDFVNEKGEDYTPTTKAYLKKIAEIEELIKTRQETIKILKDTKQDYSHQLKIIDLLKDQINAIKTAEFNHKNDL